SATNDGGCGAAAAVGVKFINAEGESFIPTGGSLDKIVSIDMSGLEPLIAQTRIVTMCDIDNPLYGPKGAAYIFAPQKGADDAMVQMLDEKLRHYARVIEKCLGMDVSELPGGGAAGGMGAGMAAFFTSPLQMGIETVLDTVAFDSAAADADYIFTGEGKLDSQSLRGKVVIGVARRAKKLNVPVIAVVGGAETELEPAYEEGVSAVFTINRLPQPLSESAAHSAENLGFVMDNILRLNKK
ncbi:MAG: glycerate kinase, partial [Oscillospiraceae bacterium]|nr:glycerate kinase [Oscillospiraceae bacterium]